MKRQIPVIVAVFALSIGGAFAQSGSVNTNATSGTYGVSIQTLGTTYPDVAVQAHDSIRFFNSSSLELLRITATGKVQIGIPPTTDDTLRLHVYESANRGSALQIENANVGDSALALFRARSDSAAVNMQAHSSIRNLTRYGQSMGGWAELMSWQGNGLVVATVNTAPLILGTNSASRLKIDSDGQVSIGGLPSGTQSSDKLVVNGAIRATQVIGAVYQDLAEWVPASEAMPPGTVVVVDGRSRNTVTPSSHPYDTRVAGVVSAQPGLILGLEAPSKEMIATTGRVKVRVDATNAPIHMGDLLVTSDKPGVAMRSEAVDLGGIKIHRPGTLIGKALEPLTSGEGEILVLLSLQ